ncbi:actin-associated protein FAM107A-like isoform X1 [Acipenser ruthenus]|uniref:actin-associated protein FAM107A-like isoform X1 n=1 Tax=Acipenser ruthenus TaxID=7906 RepID=UPI00156137BB|nr:actin-associated protein FAM107A-like isoform X1 [Acipenser ruthenus]
MGAAHGKKKEYSLQHQPCTENGKHIMNGSAPMYSDMQREQHGIGSIMAQPDYQDRNDDLIKPKKLLNPVKASKSHQELHRELLMNQKRGTGIENKPELQRVLEHRKRDQHIRKKKEEEEALRLKSPFEQELLKRQQKLDQLEKEQDEQDERPGNAPEFLKVKENLRRTSVLTSEEKEV